MQKRNEETTSQAESNGRLSESMEEEESNNKADGSSSKRPLRFYADLPEADLPEVEAFVAILGPHVDKVFVKTGAKEDANRIRVGFFWHFSDQFGYYQICRLHIT